MEACIGVEREVDKVLDKITGLRDQNSRTIEELLLLVRGAKQELSDVGAENPMNPQQAMMLVQALQTVKDSVKRLATDHRDLHSSVSKVGKVVDRNFVSDYDSTSRNDIFTTPQQNQMLNQVILQHFYRRGQLDIAETLAREANMGECVQESRKPFQELNAVLEALNRRELSPALDWVARNRGELAIKGTTDSDSNSQLELKLHKLRFVSLVKDNNSLEAIRYARKHFSKFVSCHEREIASMMGALPYVGPSLGDSPYGKLLDDSLWGEVADLFVRDACALMGLSVESALAVAVNAGCTALPALLNIKQVMLQHVGVWGAKDELPIEIDLGPNSRYHSIFACPILRQQTTETNPPLRLTCGHCISRDALSKLSSVHKLKCPYCPVEQNPADARQIYL